MSKNRDSNVRVHNLKWCYFLLQLYWLSLLHKYLVGTRVLSIQNGLKYGRNLRVYAHCTNIHGQPSY